MVRRWASEAGRLALQFYQTDLTAERKADNSPVTAADRRVEHYLVEQIRAVHPNHGIVGEELGGDGLDRKFVWVLDPIDGTRVFVAGLPTWSICLGLLRNQQPYRGLVYLPVVNEWYFTDETGTAYWGDRPLTGRLQTTWRRDSFLCGPADTHRLFSIDVRNVRGLGSVASHQCFVARGGAAAALAKQPCLWDLAGPQAILRAVDAVAVHLDGSNLDFNRLWSDRRTRSPVVIGHPDLIEYLIPRIHRRLN
jgi:fructose-1,6-bisphosphatase/inositol monophosphatase family enzyme